MEWFSTLIELGFIALWCYLVVLATDPPTRLKWYTRPSKWRELHATDFSYGGLHVFRGLFLGCAAGFVVTMFVSSVDVYGVIAGAALGLALGAFRVFGPTKESVEAASAKYEEWMRQNSK